MIMLVSSVLVCIITVLPTRSCKHLLLKNSSVKTLFYISRSMHVLVFHFADWSKEKAASEIVYKNVFLSINHLTI